jgi:hypothetical protein
MHQAPCVKPVSGRRQAGGGACGRLRAPACGGRAARAALRRTTGRRRRCARPRRCKQWRRGRQRAERAVDARAERSRACSVRGGCSRIGAGRGRARLGLRGGGRAAACTGRSHGLARDGGCCAGSERVNRSCRARCCKAARGRRAGAGRCGGGAGRAGGQAAHGARCGGGVRLGRPPAGSLHGGDLRFETCTVLVPELSGVGPYPVQVQCQQTTC